MEKYATYFFTKNTMRKALEFSHMHKNNTFFVISTQIHIFYRSFFGGMEERGKVFAVLQGGVARFLFENF